ncbi:glutaredoxin family protein [Phytoactinopolyspora limicola]|uniref:glutaredoxin family protein n=1 Tax=Phytoactinopolyspora limicola TaxID=2715536 RepID=UPI001B7D8E53|nr:glutaredoxin family protein [Phytoactinopolyspora limicola]
MRFIKRWRGRGQPAGDDTIGAVGFGESPQWPDHLPDVGAATRVLMLGRPGCHLCDDARIVIDRVCAEFGVGWEEHSIDGEPELRRRYGDQVPVTFVDGAQHDYWRVDEDRLRMALRRDRRAASGGGEGP